jgi:hypothetical protein
MNKMNWQSCCLKINFTRVEDSDKYAGSAHISGVINNKEILIEKDKVVDDINELLDEVFNEFYDKMDETV